MLNEITGRTFFDLINETGNLLLIMISALVLLIFIFIIIKTMKPGDTLRIKSFLIYSRGQNNFNQEIVRPSIKIKFSNWKIYALVLLTLTLLVFLIYKISNKQPINPKQGLTKPIVKLDTTRNNSSISPDNTKTGELNKAETSQTSYSNNNKPIVKDNIQDNNGLFIDGNGNKWLIQASKPLSWSRAIEITKANRNNENEMWRLPTKQELRDLIDPMKNPSLKIVRDYYWTNEDNKETAIQFNPFTNNYCVKSKTKSCFVILINKP